MSYVSLPTQDRSIILVAHNLRSIHNVGSLLRTCEGLGIDRLILSGYSPYPALQTGDERMPHIAKRVANQIHKTALGAEATQPWEHHEDIFAVIEHLKESGYTVCGLEQTPRSIKLIDYQASQQIALIIGREVEGIEPEILDLTDQILEIPMSGAKESFNVVQAAAMALYQLRFIQ